MKELESAIEQILSDDFEVQEGREQNQPVFDFETDYSSILRAHESAVEHWKEEPEKSKYKKGLPDYLAEKGLRNPKDKSLARAKNSYLLRQEVQKRIENEAPLRSLVLNSIDYQSSLAELAESVENVDQIRSLYKLRKLTTGKTKNSGISSEEAVKLKNCFSQGRELYLAGCGGSLMVKPLNHFYAVTAYSYGMIVLNNPVRYSKDNLPSSHGMVYLPDVVQGQFGGDAPTGTFSELFTSFPTNLVKTPHIEFSQDYTESIKSFYKTRFNVSIGTLLSMLPEMSSYYSLSTAE